MGKIKELSTVLTNQIAAGEVIERPASVVKELLENAIDANSTRIEIQIEEAGLRTIKIIDNGDGMERDDAILSIKRHTTSKLYSPEQLFRIRTLGFRGEALASITAISKTTIETSTGEGLGTKLTVKGGVIESDEIIPPIKGTTITVENIFYNTPARLKYVKTLQTEMAHISDIITKLSLSHPEIAFVLKNDGNELLRTSGTGDLRQAIAGNLGTTNARKIVSFQAENNDFIVNGYTSLPELTRSNRNYLFIFINGRSIKNYAINKAIIAGYGSTLMVGRFPITVINIQMDYLLVDVNVHPTKQEVRISKEGDLAKLITEAIRKSIQAVQRIPNYQPGQNSPSFKRKSDDKPKSSIQSQLKLSSHPLPTSLMENSYLSKEISSNRAQQESNYENRKYPKGVANPNGMYDTNDVYERNIIKSYGRYGRPSEKACTIWNENLEENRKQTSIPRENHQEKQHLSTYLSDEVDSVAHKAQSKIIESYDKKEDQLSKNEELLTSQVAESTIDLTKTYENHHPFEQEKPQNSCSCCHGEEDYLQLATKLESDDAPTEYGFPELEYFGTMHGTYLFAQNEKGLYMIDQHAAQERIKYEQLKVEIGQVSRHLQPLLVPFVLEFSKKEYLTLVEKQEMLEEIGIFLEPFGANSFQIQAHPSWIKKGEELKTIEEMIEFVLKNEKVTVAIIRRATAIMMSCKGSIKANHHISELEARQLLRDLAKCHNPYNCPHGRPVMVHFSNKDMERLFKRIQDPHQSPMNW